MFGRPKRNTEGAGTTSEASKKKALTPKQKEEEILNTVTAESLYKIVEEKNKDYKKDLIVVLKTLKKETTQNERLSIKPGTSLQRHLKKPQVKEELIKRGFRLYYGTDSKRKKPKDDTEIPTSIFWSRKKTTNESTPPLEISGAVDIGSDAEMVEVKEEKS